MNVSAHVRSRLPTRATLTYRLDTAPLVVMKDGLDAILWNLAFRLYLKSVLLNGYWSRFDVYLGLILLPF